MKKKIIRGAGLLLLLSALCALAYAGYQKGRGEGRTAARINGADVSDGELGIFLKDQENAAEAALKELAPYKIIQRELEEIGLIKPFSYAHMLEEMEKENKLRRQEKEQGGVLYGPVEYTPKTYYMKCQEEYQKLWEKEKKRTPPDEELKELYDSHPDWFLEFGTAVFECIIIPCGEMEQKEAVSAVEGVKRRMAEGQAFQEAAGAEGLLDYVQQRTFTGEDLSSEIVTMYPEIEENIYQLEKGQWSQLIENDGYEWIFLCCTSRSGQGRQSFEECREELCASWEEEYLKNLLQKLTDDAEIEILY